MAPGAQEVKGEGEGEVEIVFSRLERPPGGFAPASRASGRCSGFRALCGLPSVQTPCACYRHRVLSSSGVQSLSSPTV